MADEVTASLCMATAGDVEDAKRRWVTKGSPGMLGASQCQCILSFQTWRASPSVGVQSVNSSAEVRTQLFQEFLGNHGF